MNLPFWPNPSNYNNIELGLSRVYALLSRLDNPHQKLPPTIHIAGTNGKGSTLAFLKAIFENANLQVHCYTSPHLVRFNERIILAGAQISDDFLNEILQKCKAAAETTPKIDVTFFEGITVAAFLAFSQIKADILLLETGLGGRLDATNVIERPIATIITPISKDHTEFLGKTLTNIAFEKAGIIKDGVPVITSKQKPAVLKILRDVATKNNSEIFSFDKNFAKENLDLKISPSLAGEHQIINAKTAIAAILAQRYFNIPKTLQSNANLLRHTRSPQSVAVAVHRKDRETRLSPESLRCVSKKNIEQGIKKAAWPARLQNIDHGYFYQILPKNFQLILDGGHNEAGAKTISDWLNKDVVSKNYLICAMLQDKDSRGFLKHLVNQTEMLVGMKIASEERSKTAHEIADIAKGLQIKSQIAGVFEEAIEQIKTYHKENYQEKPARIIICGSLYLAGEFLGCK